MFWVQQGQNEPNGSKIVPINAIKIFHENDINNVKKFESIFFGPKRWKWAYGR